jgi:NhaP-type Na+/H+ or K+/H+ antiporter
LGSPVAELLKLAALLVFGGIISLEFLFGVGVKEVIFAIVVLLAARPLAFALALFRSPLSWRERLAAAWFGPRGFASVVYGLLVFGASLSRSNYLFKVIAIVIVGSMIAHSSTDVIIARWFKQVAEAEDKEENGQQPEEDSLQDEDGSRRDQIERGEETPQDIEKV